MVAETSSTPDPRHSLLRGDPQFTSQWVGAYRRLARLDRIRHSSTERTMGRVPICWGERPQDTERRSAILGNAGGCLTNPLIFLIADIAPVRAGFVEASAQTELEHRRGQGGSTRWASGRSAVVYRPGVWA